MFISNELKELLTRKMNKKAQTEGDSIFFGIIGILIIILIVIGSFYVMHALTPWWEGKTGEAELARAEQNRQIAILEAQAKLDSATRLAQAEVERAKGVAEANKIISGSITENYLKYLFVQGLQTNQMQTIYVPTNNFMPVYDLTNNQK